MQLLAKEKNVKKSAKMQVAFPSLPCHRRSILSHTKYGSQEKVESNALTAGGRGELLILPTTNVIL